MTSLASACKAAIATVTLISALAIASTAFAGEISGGVVKIGVVTDASGPLSDSNGQGSLIAAKLAAEDFQKQKSWYQGRTAVCRPSKQARYRFGDRAQMV